MNKLFSRSMYVAVFGAFLLGACSGGSIGDGSTTGSTTGGDSGPTPASLTLLASSPQLSSDASAVSAGVTLTAIVKDNNNNVMPGITVQFSTQDSGEIVVTNPAITDATGRVTAVLTTGGDPRNRSVNVVAAAGTLSRAVSIDILGTTLEISGLDSTQINVQTPYVIQLTDAAGAGIANQTVTVTSNAGNTVAADTLLTNASGQVTVRLTATQAASTLTASVLGLTATKEIVVSTDEFTFQAPTANSTVNLGQVQTVVVRWLQNGSPVPNGTPVSFSATRGTLSAASATTVSGNASVSISSTEAGFTEIVATSPALSRPNASRSLEFVASTPDTINLQANPANLATNQTADLTAIVRDPNNNLVKNAIVEFSLSDLSGGTLSSPTAVTNSQGVARVNYTASSQISATRDVVVTAKVRSTSIQATAALTVGARAVSITLGTGAVLVVKDTSTYQQPWTVLVNDSSGNPVSNADFTLSVQSLQFFKGTREQVTAVCNNEDLNLNDILDAGEDLDGDGSLDPGRVASVPVSVDLDADGTAQFFVTYPKEFGNFIRVRLIGVATVAGTETTEMRDFNLRVTVDDAPFLPFEGPFGVVGAGDFDPNDGSIDPGCANPN